MLPVGDGAERLEDYSKFALSTPPSAELEYLKKNNGDTSGEHEGTAHAIDTTSIWVNAPTTVELADAHGYERSPKTTSSSRNRRSRAEGRRSPAGNDAPRLPRRRLRHRSDAHIHTRSPPLIVFHVLNILPDLMTGRTLAFSAALERARIGGRLSPSGGDP